MIEILCDCKTFDLGESRARLDGSGFLHTVNYCPEEKWFDEHILKPQFSAKYPRIILEKLRNANEISDAQFQRLLRETENT